MRIDKYLKVARIIKRRSVANEACTGGRVSINQKIAKASSEVKPGDIISIRYGEHTAHYEVVTIMDTVSKVQASEMYRILDEDSHIKSVRSNT